MNNLNNLRLKELTKKECITFSGGGPIADFVEWWLTCASDSGSGVVTGGSRGGVYYYVPS